MIKPLSKISSILLISIFLLCSLSVVCGSAQVTYGGGGNASASYMQSKTDADYKSVQEQSGLFAGTGGYDIKVAKNTDLKGAVGMNSGDIILNWQSDAKSHHAKKEF